MLFSVLKCIIIHLTSRYFYQPFPSKSLEDEEKEIMNSEAKAEHIHAHNGWVMGFDSLKNFADSSCKVYLRRELVAWGDSVKLR